MADKGDRSMKRDRTLKDVEEALDDIRRKSDALAEEIENAENKHPPKLDHPDDGGII